MIAEPTRREILDLLRERPRPVGELVDLLGISQPGVSKHLRVLRQASLVRVRADAQRRWYEVDPRPLTRWEGSAMNADGTVERTEDGRYVISFERRLAHPVERVWAALTEPAELISWWGDAEVELHEGGRFEVSWLNTDEQGDSATMQATIVKLEPLRLLVLDGDIHGRLRWELTPDGDGTRLSFRSTFELEPEFITKVPAGWHFHLDALGRHLDGGETDLVEIPDWEPIHEAYVGKGVA